MAGIFGLTTNRGFSPCLAVAETLAEEMCLFPWQTPVIIPLEHHHLILGFVTNNNKSVPRDAFSFQGNGITCVLEGYITRTRSDCGATQAVRTGHYAQAAAMAFEKFGEKFVEYLEGVFTLLLYDGKSNNLLAGNGRFANTLIFFRQEGPDFCYSTQLGPLAKCGFFKPKLHHTHLSHLLGHGQVFSRETMLEGVEAFEPATVRVHDLTKGTWSEDNYWAMGSFGHCDYSKSFHQHLDLICGSLEAAGSRITSRAGRYVSGLSGGLDSRLVTGIAARHKKDLKTWTFGSPEAPDMVSAVIISRHLGLEHLTFTTNPTLIPESSDLYSATVDGFITADFAYGLERTKALMQQADIVLNGYAGELVLGDYVVGPKPKILWHNFRTGNLWGPDSLSYRLVHHKTNESLARYLTALASKPTGLLPLVTSPPKTIFERILAELEKMAPKIPIEFRGEQFIHTCRGSRWTTMGIISDRHFYSDGNLFYDYDVLDCCMAAPHEMRESNRMYSAVFRKLLPELGAMPNANTGIRADASPGRVLAHKITSGIKKKLLRQPASKQVTGNDPNSWSRNYYPDHYLNLLADQRTRNREFWNGDGLERLFKKHLAGEVNVGIEFGQLASVEYFCRRWLDKSPSQETR